MKMFIALVLYCTYYVDVIVLVTNVSVVLSYRLNKRFLSYRILSCTNVANNVIIYISLSFICRSHIMVT